ncbi:hypothetical protein Pint_28160 [Pistacia integerrima]|uniref:Uncharacterized protein n=1 Tax=Pistacia integerrima TaxID=434235 RepID=A0ACC0YQN8_9ROSI|nr:hypothetical protein Pint_28160 [Pistacia integerrima]
MMDLLILWSSLVALSMFMYYLYQSKKPIIHRTARCGVLEVGGAWPIIGHRHLFGGRKLIYRILNDIADYYGPVFTVRLGSHKALVESNWEMAKEIFTVHDLAFSNKPNIAASKLLFFDNGMFGFAPYWPFWHEMRKIITVELLSNYRLDMFKHIRASAVQTSIKELHKTYTSSSSKESGVLVEMKQWFKDLSYNVVLRMVAGRRLSGSSDDGDKGRIRRCQNLMTDFFYMLGVFVLSDAIPSLGWLDFGGYKKAMKRTAKELDALAGEWLEEHKQRRQLAGETREEYAFMDFMMTMLEDAKITSFDADTIYKATCLAQDEPDIHVGKDRHVEEPDIKNLVYLQATVKETFRVQPPGPVIPRSANKDCTLSNVCHVAAGTRPMVNAWKIQHDESEWSNPNEFQPQRFLTNHKDRRISLALQVVHLTLASLLQSFEVMKPSNDPADMTESPGLANEKKTPLEVLVTPRLDMTHTDVALSMFMYYLYQSKKPITHKTARCSVPEVGGAWPIIGHMHLFGGRKLIYRTLSDMADNYGSVFTIWLGSHRALVVSKWEIAKEIFTVHDLVFSSRPNIAASKLLCYDYAMFGFAPYGPYWREMRKIITVELLSNYKLDMFKHIRASEVQTSIRELYKTYISRSSKGNGLLVEMKQWFKDLSYNVILRMVAGRRLSGSSDDGDKERSRRCQNLITDFFYLLGVFVLSDAVPSLGWLDFGGYNKAMKRTAKELDALAGEWLEEHKQRRLLGGETKEEYDFMDFMMTILEDAKIPSFDADTIYKATCLNLVAASDNNMVVLTWALSLLLNNPHVLKKAQDELEIHVGKDRHVEESDIKNLVYLQAIVKETFRVQPPGPVIPRSANKDCTLSNGYHVAAGTRLMLNVWKIQHDESVWSNPNEFQPERFLTIHKDTDLRGLNFELIPFGCGRRSCAGIQLALQVSPGLLNEKVTPLEVLITPRLDSKLYMQ